VLYINRGNELRGKAKGAATQQVVGEPRTATAPADGKIRQAVVYDANIADGFTKPAAQAVADGELDKLYDQREALRAVYG